jgi:hypothetical protein
MEKKDEKEVDRECQKKDEKDEIKKMRIFIHEIKNLKPLDEEQLVQINSMNYENRMQILVAWNIMIHHCKNILEEY